MSRGGGLPAYLALRAAAAAVRTLPRPVALGLGATVGRVARDVLGLRRRVADHNLQIAFPELGRAARRALGRRTYAHFGRMMVETLRVAATGGHEVIARVHAPEATELLRDLHGRGRGVLLLTGHLGNWEVAATYMSSVGMPVTAVVKPPANRWIADYVDRQRGRLGIEAIPKPEARSAVPAALAAGRIVALVADQSPIRGTTWVPFFGRLTKTAEGPGFFAALSRAPVAFAAVVRDPDGGYRGCAEVIEESPAGEPREVVERVATVFRARLEAAIRRTPEQYLWTHRLWRREPPGPPGAP